MSLAVRVADDQDGKAIVWDTNRMKYIRTLETPHGEPLRFSAINETDVSARPNRPGYGY